MENSANGKLKIGCYCLLLFLLYCLQTSRGTELVLWGYRVDVLPCVVACAALLDGALAGGVVGFAAGALYDLSLLGAEGLYPAYFLIFGLLAGSLGQRYLRKVYPSVLLLSLIAAVGNGLIRMVTLFWIHGASPLYLLKTLGIELFLMALASPLVFWLMRRIHRKLSQR